MINTSRLISSAQQTADEAKRTLSSGAQSAQQATQQASQAVQKAAQQASQAVQTTAQTVKQGAQDVRAQLPSTIVADADRRAAERIEQNRKAMLHTGIALIVLGAATYYIVRKKK